MGFETFRAELRGRATSPEVINHRLREHPNIKPDTEGGFLTGSTYYVLNDDTHVIELEVDPSAHISCRFTLCHPPSIDVAFFEHLVNLMERLDMEATIIDTESDDDIRSYSLADQEELQQDLARFIAIKRGYWIRDVGDETMPATSREAFEHFLLPRCKPVRNED